MGSGCVDPMPHFSQCPLSFYLDPLPAIRHNPLAKAQGAFKLTLRYSSEAPRPQGRSLRGTCRSMLSNQQTWPQRLSWQSYCFINPAGYLNNIDLSRWNRLWQRCSAGRQVPSGATNVQRFLVSYGDFCYIFYSLWIQVLPSVF
jgi:hypothetical protein